MIDLINEYYDDTMIDDGLLDDLDKQKSWKVVRELRRNRRETGTRKAIQRERQREREEKSSV